MTNPMTPSVEVTSSTSVHRVRVDRTRTWQEAINATGRRQYIDRAIEDVMPIGEGEEVDVYTFTPGPEAYENGFISCTEVVHQLDLRGLKLDPWATVAMNEAEPSFADEHPNGTQLLRPDGGYDFAGFDRRGGEHSVSVRRCNHWLVGWWLTGVRK